MRMAKQKTPSADKEGQQAAIKHWRMQSGMTSLEKTAVSTKVGSRNSTFTYQAEIKAYINQDMDRDNDLIHNSPKVEAIHWSVDKWNLDTVKWCE